jgi:hypothetical protein
LTRRRLGDVLACLVLTALVLACFARLALQPGSLIVDGDHPSLDYTQRVDEARSVGNDLTFLFLPHYLKVTEHLGRLWRVPFWDASGFAGRPMVGNPQGGLFYPPVWLAWWGRSPSALGWLTVGHLLWAALGAYSLARRLGISRVASTVAAGCFQASPFVLAHTFEGHYPHVWAACWYPWAFWAFFENRAGRLRGTFALPVTLAMAFLTGHPQEWYYLAFALSLWTLIDAVHARWSGSRREAALGLARWAALVGLSFGLVAVELIPDTAAQRWTLRSGGLSLGQVSKYIPHSANVLQLLSPNALGGPADYFGHENYWEALLSFGLLPLMLALIAAARHHDRRLVGSWLTLTTAAVIFSAGRRLGLFTLLYGWVPGMNRFRVPSRSLFLASLGTAVLAGLGVDALRRLAASVDDWRLVERRFRQAATVVLAGMLVAEVVSWRYDSYEATPPKPDVAVVHRHVVRAKGEKAAEERPEPEDTLPDSTRIEPHHGLLAVSRILRDGVFWGALGATAAALAYGALRPANRRAAACALGVLALAELGVNGFALLKVAPAGRFLGPDPITAALADASADVPKPFRIRVRDRLYVDLRAARGGFEKININDWFQVHHAAELYQELYVLFDRVAPPSPGDRMGDALRRFGRQVRQQVLDRLCVALLVSDHPDPEAPWRVVSKGTWGDERFVVYRNTTALPRAYVVPRAYPAKEWAPRELALFRLIDPREAVLMKRDPLGDAPRRQPFTPAKWVPTGDPDRVVVQVETKAPGLLVVADTCMLGWSAEVDGRPAEILRGNHAQRVIPLSEPGKHEVVMRYRSPGFVLGLAVTTASALAWLAALVVLNRRRAKWRVGTSEGRAATSAHCSHPAPHLTRESRTAELDR